MIIKSNLCEANYRYMIRLTERDRYELTVDLFEGLCLILPDKTVTLRDYDIWMQGRPELTEDAVSDLYADIWEEMYRLIQQDPGCIIDIDAIESRLLREKYEQEWTEKGYIEPDENGSW